MSKFDSYLDERVYVELMLGCDEESGSVDYGDGWHGLMLGFKANDTETFDCIIREDSQGFVDVDYYPLGTTHCKDDWNMILANEIIEEDEDEDEDE